MNFIEGQLKKLGESTTNDQTKIVEYSLIQIGDKTLPDVMIDRKLNNFLQDGLNTSQPTKLWMLGKKTVMAIQVGAATRYIAKINPLFYAGAIFNLAAGIGFGYYFNILWFVAYIALTYFFFFKKIFDYHSIAAIGGTKI